MSDKKDGGIYFVGEDGETIVPQPTDDKGGYMIVIPAPSRAKVGATEGDK